MIIISQTANLTSYGRKKGKKKKVEREINLLKTCSPAPCPSHKVMSSSAQPVQRDLTNHSMGQEKEGGAPGQDKKVKGQFYWCNKRVRHQSVSHINRTGDRGRQKCSRRACRFCRKLNTVQCERHAQRICVSS